MIKDLYPLLFTAILPTGLSAQITIGAVHPIESPVLSASRGTDTLFTMGAENAVNAGQIAAYLTPEGGMLFGPSEFGVTEFAQEFNTYGDGISVDGAVLFLAQAVYTSGSPDSKVQVRLRRMNGIIGTTSTTQFLATSPNTTVAQADISMSDISAGSFAGVSWPAAYSDGAFAISYSIGGLAAGDSVNCAATTDGYVEDIDRSWLRLPPLNLWTTLLAAIGDGGNIDYLIGAVYTPGAVNVGSASRVEGLQMTLLEGNPAQDRFTLQVNIDQVARLALRVVDTHGRVMVDEDWGMTSGFQQRSYAVDGWAPGTYFVTVFNNGLPMAKRLVVR